MSPLDDAIPADASAQEPSRPAGSGASPEQSAALNAAGTQRTSSPLTAAALSFLWPGLGQLYARRYATAAIFAVPVGVAFIWLALQLLNGLDWFSLALLDESFALTLAIGAAILGAWRLVAMAHAYVTARPLRRPRVLESGLLAILVLIVVAGHTEAAFYALSFYNFDVNVSTNVIVNNGPIASQSTTPTQPADLPSSGASPSPAATPAATPTGTSEPSHRVTIALIGLSWLPGRTSANDDAMMLISLDTLTNKVAMISIPRDTAYFDYYWGGRAGINTKINNFRALVDRHQIHAPDPPLTALANEMGYLVGIKVDYYALIDMLGFENLVDAAGGICLTVPKAVVDPSYHLSIGAGYQCINGTTALKYARARHTSNDYVRAARQQQLLAALAKKLASPSGIGRLPNVLSLASKIIQTNFPLKTAKDYVSLIRATGSGDITNCVLGPPYDYHPAASLTMGAWTSRLLIPRVAGLSVYLFGSDSRYYGMAGITPAPCAG
jgi:polyisoprenyl-teichoic acid--peptidoglycan teichoic acid transferase